MASIELGWKGLLSGKLLRSEAQALYKLGGLEFKYIDWYAYDRSPSKKLIHGILPVPVSDEKGKLLPPGRPPRTYDNKVQSLGAREPRQAWGEGNQSDE
jgi:hypothetical protein